MSCNLFVKVFDIENVIVSSEKRQQVTNFLDSFSQQNEGMSFIFLGM